MTATQDTGGGPVPATNGHVTVSLTGSNGITAGDISIDAGASTCDNAGDNLNGSGQCVIVFNSTKTGTITGHASVTVDLGGGSTITRDTDPATLTIGAGPNGSETPAVKNYVDGNISITPSATNATGVAHTFTIVANALGPVTPTSIAIAPSVSPAPDSAVSSCASPTLSNGNKTATCTLIVNGDDVGTFTANATATFGYSGGLSFQRDTDPATASIGSGPGGSGPATKTYVDARITIATSGTNVVGAEHTFTVTIEKNNGSGWVPAQGVNVLASETGVGTLSGGTCDNTGGDTNASGQCTIEVTSNTTGNSTVNATATVSVAGAVGSANVNVSTTGHGAHDISNVKTWVDARISVVASDTNVVGDAHTFTVTVQKDSGSGFVAAPGVTVSVATDTATTDGTINAAASTCDDQVTDASGQCIVVVTSATTGTIVLDASADVTVNGSVGSAIVHVDIEGYEDLRYDQPDVKTWVDARISDRRRPTPTRSATRTPSRSPSRRTPATGRLRGCGRCRVDVSPIRDDRRLDHRRYPALRRRHRRQRPVPRRRRLRRNRSEHRPRRAPRSPSAA